MTSFRSIVFLGALLVGCGSHEETKGKPAPAPVERANDTASAAPSAGAAAVTPAAPAPSPPAPPPARPDAPAKAERSAADAAVLAALDVYGADKVLIYVKDVAGKAAGETASIVCSSKDGEPRCTLQAVAYNDETGEPEPSAQADAPQLHVKGDAAAALIGALRRRDTLDGLGLCDDSGCRLRSLACEGKTANLAATTACTYVAGR